MEQRGSLNSDCPLCRLVAGEVITKLYWDDELTICVDCKDCKIPMAVIKCHDSRMTPVEDSHISTKALEYFGDKFVGIRMETRKIHDHAHYHILLKGG